MLLMKSSRLKIKNKAILTIVTIILFGIFLTGCANQTKNKKSATSNNTSSQEAAKPKPRPTFDLTKSPYAVEDGYFTTLRRTSEGITFSIHSINIVDESTIVISVGFSSTRIKSDSLSCELVADSYSELRKNSYIEQNGKIYYGKLTSSRSITFTGINVHQNFEFQMAIDPKDGFGIKTHIFPIKSVIKEAVTK